MKLKELPALLMGSLLLAGCGDEPGGELDSAATQKAAAQAVELNSLQNRNEVFYAPNESKPFSGWANRVYSSGQMEILGEIKDGKRDGPWTAWHENGQKKSSTTHKDGQLNGPATEWHSNGQEKESGPFKNNKPHGLWKSWDENGQKLREGTMKDGVQVGSWEELMENVIVRDSDKNATFVDRRSTVIYNEKGEATSRTEDLEDGGKLKTYYRPGVWDSNYGRAFEERKEWYDSEGKKVRTYTDPRGKK